jgi:hypothetical protein
MNMPFFESMEIPLVVSPASPIRVKLSCNFGIGRRIHDPTEW